MSRTETGIRLTSTRLLGEMFDLLEKGHVKPIQPMKIFRFENIVSAFRYMRDGKHMGNPTKEKQTRKSW